MGSLKKFFIVFSLVLMTSFVARSSELRIHLKNGGDLSFILDTKPVITFEGESLIVQCEDASYSAYLYEILYYEYIEIATDIESYQKKEDNLIIIDGHILYSKFPNGSNVRVYSLDGMMLGSYKIDNGGYVDLNLTSLPKGIFILKTPLTSIKIANK